MTMTALQARTQGDTEFVGLLFGKAHQQQDQTLASWTQCCRNNGIMLPINVLGMLSLNLAATRKSGGAVTNAQMVTCTAGLLL